MRQWADDINAAARNTGYRPQSLLVYLNPFGGSQRAREIWTSQVLPVFRLAGPSALLLLLCMCSQGTMQCTSSTCQKLAASVHGQLLCVLTLVRLQASSASWWRPSTPSMRRTAHSTCPCRS